MTPRPPDLLIDVATPLGITVRCTEPWWRQIAEVKHPAMNGRLAEVVQTLADPDEIRRSRKATDVLLFYRGERPRWVCVVTRVTGSEGFVVTAYPTDAIKIGDVIWKRSA